MRLDNEREELCQLNQLGYLNFGVKDTVTVIAPAIQVYQSPRSAACSGTCAGGC